MDKEAAAFRASALRGQRFILGIVALVSIWFWGGLVLIQREIKASKAMSARLKG